MRPATLLVYAAALVSLPSCGAPPAPATEASPQAAPDDLADALARLAREPEGPGRRPMTQQLRRAAPEQALPVLRAGLTATDPAVRAAAAFATGRRHDGRTLAPQIITLATEDAVIAVRVAACRALGQLRPPGAWAPLQQNLSHEAAQVRVAALRALARIDSGRAAEMPELGLLQLDPDPHVAGAATKVSRRVALQQ